MQLNSLQLQQHTNELKQDKNIIRNIMYSELQHHPHLDPNVHYERTNPNNQQLGVDGNQSAGVVNLNQRRRMVEVSGLMGHRIEAEPESLQEGFSGTTVGGGLGNLLNQQPSYNFKNSFFQPGVLQSEVSKDRSNEFRAFIDNQRQDEERQRQLSVSNGDLLKTNGISGKPMLDASALADTSKTPFNDPFENTRYNKVRRSVVNIDSSHRDKVRYPEANNYKIRLPRSYQHVKEVTMVSSEIPNTDRVVRDDPAYIKRAKNRRVVQCGELLNIANNNFYWNLAEDADDNWDCIIYNAPLTPGNYVAQDCNCGETTLQSEIQNKVSTVNHYQDSTPTTMLVDIDSRTNVVTITSIESVVLEIDPIFTTTGTNIVTVRHSNHGFVVGDNVVILGSTSVGSIPDSNINGSHVIYSVLSVNSYEIQVNAIAQSTSAGGGSNVTAGIEKPMKLLFSNVDTIGGILGFPQQDSSDPLSRNIEFIDVCPPDLYGNSRTKTECSFLMPPARIQSTSHGLIPGETILISETQTIPNINGLQTVTKVITSDVFEIGVNVKLVNNQTETKSLRIGKLKQSLDTSLTVVNNLGELINGNIQTSNVHGFNLGDNLFIANVVNGIMVGGNSINGLHSIATIPSSTTFGLENNIEYAGNYGNAWVFPTTSIETIPITGVIPQNNGVFTPYPTDTIFSPSNAPDYVILEDFSTTPDVNINIEVSVDTVASARDPIPLKNTAWQTFKSNCMCTKKLLSIWIRVGNPSILTGILARLELFEVTGSGDVLLGSIENNEITNAPGVGTHISISNNISTPIYLDPAKTYKWTLTSNPLSSTFTINGNLDNIYPYGRSDISPNHDYEFRAYISADIQAISHYSVTTGRFAIQTPLTDVSMEVLTQRYAKSLDSKLRFIKDASVKSHGLFRFTVLHNMLATDYIYVRRISPPYRSSEPIVSPNILNVHDIDAIQSKYRFDTTTIITNSTYANSIAIDNLDSVIVVKLDNKSLTYIQNIYPASNGYFCRTRSLCKSDIECLFCTNDYLYIRNSNLLDLGINGNATPQILEGCYKLNQVYSDMSIVCSDVFDLSNVVTDTSVISVSYGEFVKLDTPHSSSSINGQNSIFNLATIIVDNTDPSDALDIITATPHFLHTGDAVYCSTSPVNCDFSETAIMPLFNTLHDTIHHVVVPDGNADPLLFKIYGTGFVSSNSFGPTYVVNKQFYYHKICSDNFTPLETFFSNSYCGLIESNHHNIQNDNIYIGKVTTTPDLNGLVPFNNMQILDNNFISWINSGNCIVTGNVGHPNGAGEFVFPAVDFVELTPSDITVENNGVIVADNSFVGGERVYFTNDTNINAGTPNELGNNIFTVSTSQLTNEQFSLVETPLIVLGDLYGNIVATSIIETQTIAGNISTPMPVDPTYNILVPSGTTSINVNMKGAGGGNGQADSTGNGITPGGLGGSLKFTINVFVGSDIEPGDFLNITVGSAGSNGNLVVDAGLGGYYGSGGDSGNKDAFRVAGGGGGYSSIYNATKGTYIAIVGGGGGGGASNTSIYPKGGNGTGGAIGGDGDNTTLNGGGKGGTQIAGGLAGVGGGVPQNGSSLKGGKGGNTGIETLMAYPMSGGGGGGGYFGGGGGGGKVNQTNGAAAGGGGSGFIKTTAADVIIQSTIIIDADLTPANTDGYIDLELVQDVVGFGSGHFAEIPENEISHSIFTVEPLTNGTFISESVTNFPNPSNGSTPIFLTDNLYGDDDIAAIKDKFTSAIPVKLPAPTYNRLNFTTTGMTGITLTTSDIDDGTGVLQDNSVDIISTQDVRFPGLNGLSWLTVNGNVKTISNIIRDSTGSISPVMPGLQVNDYVHLVSGINTVPDLNGTFQVRYVDLSHGSNPEFYELSGLTILDNGPTLGNANASVVSFRTTLTGNTVNNDGCININDISVGCPTSIRATAHGLPIGSNVNVVLLDVVTNPPIDISNVGVIVNTIVSTEDSVILPKHVQNLNAVTISTCNLQVDTTDLFITQTGRWSRELLSTNCGVPQFTVDTANAQTIITTETRKNIRPRVMFEIVTSTPELIGSTTITVNLASAGGNYTSLPLKNGQDVIISGHHYANPTVDGSFKVFQVTTNTFKIMLNTIASSTGGIGGYVTMNDRSTVAGHGLYTGDKVLFEDTKSTPDLINNQIFEITVLNDTQFTIPVIVDSISNVYPGTWCTNKVTLNYKDHGFANNDKFYLYGATQFAGLYSGDLNTTHGEKRNNILTIEEQQTRKFATVIDDDHIQFESIAFPVSRTLGGGYDICISASNHNFADQVPKTKGGPGYKNYGFNAIQKNLNCNGDLYAAVNLETEPYILMTSEKLTNILDTGSLVDKIFAKIQLTTKPGTILYDTFITSPKTYENPDKVLDEIDIQFYRRDGKPFDFLGRDHSFSLEILEYQDRLLGTNIQSGRMKEDRGPVSQQGFVESTISGFHPEQNLLQPSQLQQTTNLTQRINKP